VLCHPFLHHATGGGGGQRRGAGDAVETAGSHHRRPLQRPAEQPPAVHRRPEKLGRVISKYNVSVENPTSIL